MAFCVRGIYLPLPALQIVDFGQDFVEVDCGGDGAADEVHGLVGVGGLVDGVSEAGAYADAVRE